jgi:formylglycine-generating enzyme required for sulfatase activity
MIEQLVAVLEQKFEDLTAEEIADILWLTLQQWQSTAATLPKTQPGVSDSEPPIVEIVPPDKAAVTPLRRETPPSIPAPPQPKMAGLTTSCPQPKTKSQAKSTLGAPLAIPDAPALRSSQEILKALRPLIRRVPSAQASYLDVPATVQAIAKTDLWTLKLQPVLEPWLELAIVVDATPSMVIWQRTILSLRRVLAQSGVFRDVRMWSLETQDSFNLSANENSPEPKLCIRSGFGLASALQPPCRPQELLDPNGRRLILVISDCIAPRWDTQPIRDMLQVWAEHGPMALVQVLPEWLWNRTALSDVVKGQVYSHTPGQSNQSLSFVRRERWRRNIPVGVKVPVLTLEPAVARRWSQMVAGKAAAPGLLFSSVSSQGLSLKRSPDSKHPSFAQATLTPQQRLEQFRNFSSPMARRLAGLLAACPEVNLPIVRMVQAALLPDAQQVHVAEVLLGGLFKPQTEITAHTPADQVQYVFHDDVQPLVQDTVPPDRAFAALSAWLNHRFGSSLEDFRAYVTPERIEQVKPFAGILLDVLKRRGDEYAEIVNAIESIEQSQYPDELTEQEAVTQDLESTIPELKTLEFETAHLVRTSDIDSSFPPLQVEQFTIATISLESESELSPNVEQSTKNLTPQPPSLQRKGENSKPLSSQERGLERSFPDTLKSQESEPETTGYDLQPFEFTIVTLAQRRQGFFQRKKQWVIQRQQQSNYQFIEVLDKNLILEMVAIPDGTFLMGSPEQELGRYDNEGSQHEVVVSKFFMGKYPITQAQWRFVASLPQVNRELKLDPSRFKGDNRPVECVSWYDAVEFCDRLSQYSHGTYRLPTEAEWEYACRARTTTPFHFGETITTDLANYCGTDDKKLGWSGSYGRGLQGEFRRETRPIDHFGIANAFGLCDMHGNVWEWCLDHWHDNYQGAPNDGSAWLTDDESARRVVRGGSWDTYPRDCRCASRHLIFPDIVYSIIGFRVVCESPRILQ